MGLKFMPIRSDPSEVRALLGIDGEDRDVITHIEMASQMVDALLGSSSLGSIMLKQIEMYLACHIYAQGTPEVVRESYGDASFQYGVPSGSGEGLCATKWGQMAKALDLTGKLSNLDKSQVSLHVI
jgi:hypothetical protein